MDDIALRSDALDMDPDEFRRQGHAAIDRIADFIASPDRWPVFPGISPGDLRARLPAHAPDAGEAMDRILTDFDDLIMPATTHWNHPGFMAYFGISASGPGILGELLAAGLNVNAMLWRTGPAATELEETVLAWLARLMGLPDGLDGTINDTASSSTLYALAAARESLSDLKIRELGLAGRTDLPALRFYCSGEAHSSVDKAVLTLGLGLAGLRRIPTDDRQRMDPAALAAAVSEDRRAGIRPVGVVATVGTTSTTAVDPVAAIADICEAEGMWLHVDAAYGGAAALLPELRWIMDGCERADSLVVNPHKWMFVPIDCSVLYTRRPDMLKRAFSLVPEYLTTTAPADVRNLMDYGVSLGRRFRALKLWFVLRHFGADGMRRRLRRHIALARSFAEWVDAHPRFERMADRHFSVVAFRFRPAGETREDVLERINMQVLERVNESGEVFLSHTKIDGRYALRLAIGNIRTSSVHVERAWQLAREAAECVTPQA
ncbi:MAG TPA: pyridoxal-dependent decarboxylase [Longimicrobiales bacterium]|nr:pyridoxal-dependent decarboxylase [Longimicrobiales bacterium]